MGCQRKLSMYKVKIREDMDSGFFVDESVDNYDYVNDFQKPGWKENTTTILINVTDVNDNAPVFKSDKYFETVQESVSKGTILTVAANDEDIGENGKVQYSIQGMESVLFKMDPGTGALSIASNLTNKIGYKCFNVTAKDQGNPPLNSTTSICINVTDINNNNPNFEKPNDTISIPEDFCKYRCLHIIPLVWLGSSVTYLLKVSQKERCEDLRCDINKAYAMLVAANISATFLVEWQKDHIIPCGISLDSQMQLIFLCSHHAMVLEQLLKSSAGRPSSPATLLFLSFLTYKHRNQQFHALGKLLRISNYALNRQLYAHYSLSPLEGTLLTMRLQWFGHTLWHSDNELIWRPIVPYPPLDWQTEESLIERKLEDENHQRYTWTPKYDLDSTCPGTKIYTVIITDKDFGVNAKINYELESKADNSYFKIDDSGNVNLEKKLDYEKKSLYQVEIKASDAGTPSLPSIPAIFLLSVNVTNINDEPPEFLQPNDTFTIKEGPPPIAIGSVKAKDSGFDLCYTIANEVNIVFAKPIDQVRSQNPEFIKFLQSVVGDEYEIVPGKLDVLQNDQGEPDPLRKAAPDETPEDAYPGTNLYSDGQINPLYNNFDENDMGGPLPDKESLNKFDGMYHKNINAAPDNFNNFDDDPTYSMPEDNSKLDLDSVIKERDAEMNRANNNSMTPYYNPDPDLDVEATEV
ncbi:protein dachsous [Octopus bimaculoides]|uniref:protein dachsous n=1 Tax=Octopus bimaculoides TaxID=37653 RepID=UPI0022E8DF85|nr:protein dachsous [Octopus bimaculoides]